MKDNSLDGHRGKVALSETNPAAAAATTLKGDGTTTTNFDDDYNEWELGIGDLIIDLDADIEKTNGGGGETPAFLGMSSKSCSFEHQATVDKGLKMKIKRKTVGSRYAEAKHEIVQPPPPQADEKRRAGHKKSRAASAASSNGRDAAPNGASAPSPAASPARVPPPGSPLAEPAAAPNLPPSSGSPPMPNLTVKLENGGGKFATSPATVVPPVAPPPPQKVAVAPAPVVVQQQQQVIEERPASPPLKKQKLDPAAPAAPDGNDEDECPGSPSPEMKDTSTCTSVGTAVEPDCLGPCEPGTSVMLEGIVWQETEGGVLVVNVTWRGKTYVGTLLDCTKHDWAPPRFCESPTSDADSKTSKGRGGKRGGARGGCELSASFDARNCVQSKLRNGKGRRTTVNSNGFTVPSSPAKGSDGGGKRKSRPSSEPPSESSKRSRPQQQQPATAAASTTAELITCPEPNCSKRYKHLNGLKYHRAHAHSGGGDKASASAEEAADTDNSKATNSSDNEEGSLQESASVSTSPAPSSSDALPPPPTKASTETSSSSSGLPDEPSPQQDVVPMDVSVDAAAPIETAVSAVTTSVITSSSSSSSDAPPPHAFSQLSPAALAPPFPPAAASPPAPPLVDKSKTKQDRPTVVDKYKPKSPPSSSVVVTPAPNIRPIVPAPLITLSPALPPGGALLNPALKPIQPKPTILGEPSTVNPALEGLKKDKSGSSNKHKSKKSSGSSKGDKKPLVLPLSCDPLELTTTSAAPSSYPSLEAASPLAPKEDMSLPADDPLNENIQSPAYSDISDANDTAPVLESEVGGKEKEDKVGKSTPDAAQSPASASISGAYGMYPYYSQPPYLLPSVSPDNKVVVAAAAVEPPKKVVDPVKDRPWSSPGVDRQPQQSHPPDPPPHHELDKKVPSSQPPLSQGGSRESPAAAAVPEYPVPQHYPYPYGYVQGYPYPVDTSSYHHMHMLETDPHYKQQYKQYVDEHNRLYKEQQQQQHHHQQQLQQQHHHHQSSSSSSSHHHSSSQQHHHHQSKSHHSSVIKEERKERAVVEKHAPNNKEVVPEVLREMEMRPPSLKEKHQQSETHQILKENIELKSQMEEGGGGGGKGKANQYEMAMLFERHKEDMRRYYTYQDRLVEQQQSKLEPGIHHHTHHHQTLGSSSSHHPYNKKDDHLLQHKQQHYGDRAAASPAKDHVSSSKHSLQHSSSPKGSLSSSGSKEYNSSSSKKDQQGSSKEDKKVKQEKAVVESEGQKPTMETTGPPPPPTNSYAYLHPSYLQPPPHAFAHMGPFEPMGYRGNPMLAPPPHYANAPYAMHPQIRYVAPPPPEDPKLHHAPSKALDMLHQVSQNYTTTHKIHELAEHAIMSPTPTAPPTASAPPTPTAVAAPTAVVPKGAPSSAAPPPPTPEGKGEGAGGPRDASRSPPTQRHLHTHHHTHVGVGYPIYDPYSAIIAPGASPTVDCKPIHPLQVKPPTTPSAGTTRFWP